jgi:COMPASS component SWD1
MAAWNPKRPNIITCGAFGTLFRWVPDYPLKWSPLVPGLEEIEENVIYEEREDEFDFVTIDD